MALTRTRKRTTKAVKLLTDPDPQFVSLVSNGANQTPFQVVKSADAPNEDSEVVVAGVRAADSSTQEREDVMAKKANGKKLVVRTNAKSTEVGLAKLVFSASNFESEKAVRAYLDDNGYADGDITQLDNKDFEVLAADEGTLDGIKAVKGDDGVTRHIGETKVEEEAEEVTKTEAEPEAEVKEESEDVAEGKEEATKTDGESGDGEEATLATKYDRWWASYSEATSIKGVMREGVDGLPPAIHDVNDAMYTALRNAILAGEKEKIPVITAEFGTLVSMLVDIFDYATMPEEEVQKHLGDNVADKETTQKSQQEQTSIDTDAIIAQVMKQVEEKFEALSNEGGSLQLVSKSVEEANGVSTNLAEQLEKAVKQAGTQQEVIEEMQKTIKAQASSINDLERVATVSRSIDDDGQQLTQVEREAKSQKTSDSSLLRNDLGFG